MHTSVALWEQAPPQLLAERLADDECLSLLPSVCRHDSTRTVHVCPCAWKGGTRYPGIGGGTPRAVSMIDGYLRGAWEWPRPWWDDFISWIAFGRELNVMMTTHPHARAPARPYRAGLVAVPHPARLSRMHLQGHPALLPARGTRHANHMEWATQHCDRLGFAFLLGFICRLCALLRILRSPCAKDFQ